MAEDAFGPAFEIHGGGLDLVFPHHENELAQSLALGHEFARVWMHNGMLGGMGGEKMSKSLGNDVSLRNVARHLGPRGRTALLLRRRTGESRSSSATTSSSRRARSSRRSATSSARRASRSGTGPSSRQALDDDFNTPEALAVLHGWRDHELLRRAFGIFGLESIGEVEEAPAELAELAERRRDAREAKDFAEADRLRDEIAAAGWEVRDVAEPPGYRLVRRS